MALQVWLPLNGNIKNLGLSNLKFSLSGGITTDSTGKIGSCYKRASIRSGGRIASNTTINLNGSISMFCWAKVTACVGDTANGLVSNHSHENNTGFGITVKLASASDFRISCSTGNGSGRTYMTYYGTTNIKDKWCHLGLTYNKTSNTLKLWVNGSCEYTGTYTNSSRADYIWIFDWSTTYSDASYLPACSINDVRIYDHCLSEDEIHELSLGKITHYPLNGEDFITNNVAANHINFSNISSYDSGYTSISDCEIGGKKIVITNKLSWCEASLTVPITETGTYTLSVYCKPISRSSTAINLTLYFSGCGYSDNFTAASWSNPGTWQRISLVRDFLQTGTLTIYLICYGGSRNSSYTISAEYCKLQVEKMPEATNYSLSTLNPKFIDVSGYHNDGTLVGPSTFVNSPRYNKGTNFSATTTNYIQIKKDGFIGPYNNHEMSFSFWINTLQTGNRHMILGQVGNYYNNIELSTSNVIRVYWNATPDLSGTGITCTANTWTHVVIVVTGSYVKCYKNGELTQTWTGTTSWGGMTGDLLIGTDLRIGQYFLGSVLRLSDFRIYATALSADDVLKLYKLGNV